jgi:hypothetical protein
LRGAPPGSPAEGNKSSAAIVGVDVFETDDDYFVSYTEKDDFLEAYDAMKNSKKLATALQAGVPTSAPFLRAGFQTGVGFTMNYVRNSL